MSTATLDAADAARLHPVIAIVLDAVPRSGTFTSVPLVAEQPGGGGGGVVPVVVNSSRFGEPVPGLPTTPVVAPVTSAFATCAGVRPVLPASTSAAAPATC